MTCAWLSPLSLLRFLEPVIMIQGKRTKITRVEMAWITSQAWLRAIDHSHKLGALDIVI